MFPDQSFPVGEGSGDARDEGRFLSCTNCGKAFPLDALAEDEDCYMCGGVIAVRIMPKPSAPKSAGEVEDGRGPDRWEDMF